MFLLNPSMRFDPAQTKIIAMDGCQWEPLVPTQTRKGLRGVR